MSEKTLRDGERPWLRLATDVECLEPTKQSVEIKKSSRHDCKHWTMVVDDALRRVVCQQCGEQLDPVECLLNLARAGHELDWRVDMIRKFQEKESADDKKKYLKTMKPLINLIGESSLKDFRNVYGSRGGTGGKWVEVMEHKTMGLRVGFSRDGTYWKEDAAKKLVPISADEAKQMVSDGH